MTSRDEALRALEKDVEKVDLLLSKSRKLDPDIMFGRVFIKHRETIAAILATASEQAPVAIAQVLEIRKAEDEEAWFGRVEFAEPLKVGDLLYSSPAHTSEARDADALARFTEYFVKNYPGDRGGTLICDPAWHAPKIFRAAKYAIDAAMRQENGDE